MSPRFAHGSMVVIVRVKKSEGFPDFLPRTHLAQRIRGILIPQLLYTQFVSRLAVD